MSVRFSTKTILVVVGLVVLAPQVTASPNGATLAVLLLGAWWVTEYDKHKKRKRRA